MTECWLRCGDPACGTFYIPWVSTTPRIPLTNKKCSIATSCWVCSTFCHANTAGKTCTKTIKRFRCTCVTWKIATRFRDTCTASTKSWTSYWANRVIWRTATFANGTNTFGLGAPWTMTPTKSSTLRCLNKPIQTKTIQPKKQNIKKKPDVQNPFMAKSRNVFWKLFRKMRKSPHLRSTTSV